MAYYRVCSNCGSNLDPGERCDCEREQKSLGSLERREEDTYKQPVAIKKEHFVKKQSTHSSHKSIVIGFVS